MFPMVIGPIVGALIGAGASFLGGRRAERVNVGMAREQMRFQERMSSTAYQRAVADMRLAGINPMMAAGQGGASTPGGARAQVQDIVTPALSSARQGMLVRAELKKLNQEYLNLAETQKLLNKQWLEVQNRTQQQYGFTDGFGEYHPGLIEFQKALMGAQAAGIRSDNVLKGLDARIYGSA